MPSGSRIPLFACLLLLAAFAVDVMAQDRDPQKPNIVILFIDDLGYGDTGPLGCKDIPTPHIDRLAREGVACPASYITNPPCCPSRSSMLMGQYGQRFGKYGMSRGLAIPEDRPTLAEFLRDSGYVTGQIGKWDVGSKAQGPLEEGFLEVPRRPPAKIYPAGRAPGKLAKHGGESKYICITESGQEAWLTDVNGDHMVEFIERNQKVPFFLYFSPEAVHSPSDEVPERLRSRTSVAKGDARRRALGGAVVSVDDQVGKLLMVLEKHKLRDKTLIIFSSDNGANEADGGSSSPFSGGKGDGTQQEGWVRVPAIFSMPGVLPQGRTYDGLTCTLDYYATIAALLQKAPPPHLDGVDIFPFLKGEKKGDAHDFLYWLNNDPDDAPRRHLAAVRWQKWRLYKDPDHGWKLFNLEEDPLEQRDVASQHPEIANTMRAKHEKWAAGLAPLGKITKGAAEGTPVPTGHGWVYAKGWRQ